MPTPKSKRTVLLQSSNHDSESDSTTEEFSLGASSVVGETNRIIGVPNTNDSGFGSLRNAVAPSQDESPESAGQDLLTREDYSEISSYKRIETGNGDDSVFRSTLGIINTGNNSDSITPSINQGIGTKFITGGNANDSLAGNGQDTVFGDERLDILIGDYSEPSRGETQFNGFPGLSISGNNTSRVTSTGDGYSDDNNSLESDYRATLYGGPGEDFFNARSDTSSPLPPINQSPAFTDGIEDKPSFQFNGFPGLSIFGDSSGGNGSSESDGADTLYGGLDEINFLDGNSGDDSPSINDQTLIIEPHTDQLFSSGIGSVETTIFLPAVQKVREAAHSSGSGSSDGAWALGSTFELTSGVPFSSQTEKVVGLY